MRVCFVIKGLGPGGAERLLVETATPLVRNGVQTSVVYALDDKQHLSEALTAAGVDVECLSVRRLADVRWVWRLVAAVRAARPDVVHVHSPALAPLVRFGARLRLFGRPRPSIVSTEHNAWSTYHVITRVTTW